MATLRTGVIYLQKDKLQIYSPYAGNVLELKFTAQMVRDLDIVDLELIETTIKAFVMNGKIAPANLVIVLADNAYFTKDFLQPAVQKTGATAITPEVTKEILQSQAEQFIEHVPFDNVVSKTIPLKNGIKVCATNKDFYQTIGLAFEHNGFSVLNVFPALVFGTGLGTQPVLTPPMATTIIAKANTLKQYDLLGLQVYEPDLKQETEEVDEVALEKQQNKKPSKKQIYLVVAIFAFLVVLLVILVMQFTAPPPKHSSTAAPAAPAPATAGHEPEVTASTPTVSVSNTASASTTQISSLAVQIINTGSTTTTAETLREKMNTYNFKSVTTQTQSSVGSSSTVVFFGPDVSQSVKDLVLGAVRQVKTNITVQDKTNSVYDITIILGE